MNETYDPLDTLKLENQLCFPLYACSKEIVRLYAPYLDAIGLTYTQYIAMMVMWDHKGITAKQMGQILFLDSGTLTPVLKRLEEKELITRCRAKEDERNLWVCITPKGDALKEQVRDIPMLIAKQVGMTQEEASQLHKLLHKLLQHLN